MSSTVNNFETISSCSSSASSEYPTREENEDDVSVRSSSFNSNDNEGMEYMMETIISDTIPETMTKKSRNVVADRKKNKLKRMLGKSYVNLAGTAKKRKKVKVGCGNNCRLNCHERVN